MSNFLKAVTVRDFGVPEGRIRVIPNFVDTELFRRGRDPCHRGVFAPAGEKIVMHVSNFRPVKRVVDVIEVFAGIRRSVPARLVMAGDGPDRPRATERARRLGVDGDVTVPGQARRHRGAAVVRRPLSDDERPRVVRAGGARGLCRAAFRWWDTGWGGLPEVVPDGEAGVLVPVGAVQEARRGRDRYPR